MRRSAVLDKLGAIGTLLAAASCPACFPLLAVVGSALGLGILARFEGYVMYVLQGFVLLALAATATIFVFAVTLAVNVPINKELMTWSASAPPANVMEVWRPWDQVNTIRTIFAVGVFGLEVLALSLGAQGQQVTK